MTKPELIRKVESILKCSEIDLPQNADAKEGLSKAIEILNTGQKDLSGITELKPTQARAIAKFAVDFNNMKDSGEFFIKLGEIIKRRND